MVVVYQDDKDKLKATVYQAEKDRVIQEPLSIDDGGGSITVDGTVTVTGTNLDIRNLTKTRDEIYTVLKTDAGVAYDARDKNWNLNNSSDSITAYKGGTWTLDSPSDGTYIGDIKFGESLPSGTNNIGKVDINDICSGTQTNDVKVTLDGETVTTHGRQLSYHSTTVTSSGDTTLITPASGKKLKIYSFTVNNQTTSERVVILKIASNQFFKTYLSRYGGSDGLNLGNNFIEGNADESVVVNLNSAGTVHVNIFYVEE